MSKRPAVISDEFGELVRNILGSDSFAKAFLKTEVSTSYVLHMSRGKVPSREIVEQFASGYGVDPMPLLIAAGYEDPKDPVEYFERLLEKRNDFTAEDKELILKAVREVAARYSQVDDHPEKD